MMIVISYCSCLRWVVIWSVMMLGMVAFLEHGRIWARESNWSNQNVSCILIFFFFFSFLWPCLQHMGVSRLGGKSELQLQPTLQLVATLDPQPTRQGRGSNLHPHRNCVVVFLACWTMMGTQSSVLVMLCWFLIWHVPSSIWETLNLSFMKW